MIGGRHKTDVLVIGSGFGGCLTAHVLSRLGYDVVVVDRSQHPRFAIGESSTPVADATLAELAERYDLPWLKPLRSYGRAKEVYPNLPLGIKRGFSYFRHQPEKFFQPSPEGQQELLVTASSSNYDSDTHWMRSEVDSLFASQLAHSGVCLWEGCQSIRLDRIRGVYPWRVYAHNQQDLICDARFVIDASGRSGVVASSLGIGLSDDVLETNSRAMYAHVTGLQKWPLLYEAGGGDLRTHPFPCELAAVHHLTDEGWMWQLGFDQGTTSVGWLIDQRAPQLGQQSAANMKVSMLSPQQEFQYWLERYPSLAEQFAQARTVAPPTGCVRTKRLQFLRNQVAGCDWLALPATAGFVDPLHSTGIAHTLHAIRSVGQMFELAGTHALPSAAWLAQYSARVRHDLLWIDQLVVACYETRQAWDCFVASTMLYFAAATWCEHATAQPAQIDLPFLASDSGLRSVVDRWRQMLKAKLAVGQIVGQADLQATSNQAIRTEAIAQLREWLKPFDQVGLLDPAAQNRYAHTAAPPKEIAVTLEAGQSTVGRNDR